MLNLIARILRVRPPVPRPAPALVAAYRDRRAVLAVTTRYARVVAAGECHDLYYGYSLGRPGLIALHDLRSSCVLALAVCTCVRLPQGGYWWALSEIEVLAAPRYIRRPEGAGQCWLMPAEALD